MTAWRSCLLCIVCALSLVLSACNPSSSSSIKEAEKSLHSTSNSQEDARSFLVLHVNDVYRIYGVDGGTKGGYARLRTLRQKLEASGKPVLVLHAGDFLFPSMMSRTYKGKQMIDVMNLLDGEKEQMDSMFFTVFGNHEFDLRRWKDAKVLQARVNESEFYWLNGNITWKDTENGDPSIASKKILQSKMLLLNGIKVGLFGVTTNLQEPDFVDIDDDYIDVARRLTKQLRDDGADVVIALTHLRIEEDTEILHSLADEGPDIIFGGHEHNQQARKIRGRYVVKADADIRSATIASFEDVDGEIDISFRFINVDEKLKESEQVSDLVNTWQQRYDRLFCTDESLDQGCLDESIGKTNVELVGEELEIRRYETNLGNFIVDEALKHFREEGAQIAFLNSGSIRINQDIPEGTVLTERHLREMFQYPSEMRLIKIDGDTLQAVIEHSIEDWTGNGWWLQVAGFRFQHDIKHHQIKALSVRDKKGQWRAVSPDDQFIAVTNDFLMNPHRGQDGYDMLKESMLIEYDEEYPTLIGIVREAIRRDGKSGISPRRDGRICSTDRAEYCSWSK